MVDASFLSFRHIGTDVSRLALEADLGTYWRKTENFHGNKFHLHLARKIRVVCALVYVDLRLYIQERPHTFGAMAGRGNALHRLEDQLQ